MRRFTVRFERDEGKLWVATVRGVAGVHTQGRTIVEARRRVREALALAIGDRPAQRAQLVDDVDLPASVKRALAALTKARAREAAAAVIARKAALSVTRTLTQRFRMSRRDVAALTGYSFQRIQQLTEEA